MRAATACMCSLAFWFAGCAPEPPATQEVDFAAGDGVQQLRAGAAAVSISPTETEYLAGGLPYRSWARIHDELWARAVVLDDGIRRVALVSVDLIGLYHDDVQRARAEIQQRSPVDYALIAATHTHNGPDTLGAWSPQLGFGPGYYRSGLPSKIAQAVQRAAASLTPASVNYYHGPAGQPRLNKDTRPPNVVDDTLAVWQAREVGGGAVVATVVHFAAHPTTIPSVNFDISSDFVHYLREAIEKGGADDDGPIAAQGGVCLFFNGALGGRITPASSGALKRNRTRDLGYDRAQGYGCRLAGRAIRLLANSAERVPANAGLAVRSCAVAVRLENPVLLLGTRLGLFDRPLHGVEVSSEVALIELGPLAWVAVPGMLFPESVRGGATPGPGSDFPSAALEQPLVNEIVPDRRTIVVGLANDMLGYLIPLVLWDEVSPYGSEDGEAPYGEMVSPGPNALRAVTQAFRRLGQSDQPAEGANAPTFAR